MKNIKTLIILLLAVLILGGCSHNTPTPEKNAPAANETENNNTDNQTPEATEVAVEIKNFAFSPASLTVKAGTTVTWTNQDSAPHNVKSDTLSSPDLSKGESFSFTFNTTGEYNYICGIHPLMKAKIIVE